jgi:hypothetical protein
MARGGGSQARCKWGAAEERNSAIGAYRLSLIIARPGGAKPSIKYSFSILFRNLTTLLRSSRSHLRICWRLCA